MKTSELIEVIHSERVVQYEDIKPKMRTIATYIEEQYFCEAVFMVLMLTNNICGGKIVPANEFSEALYLETEKDPIEDIESNQEIISVNSFIIK